jgi:hypothetical protein
MIAAMGQKYLPKRFIDRSPKMPRTGMKPRNSIIIKALIHA